MHIRKVVQSGPSSFTIALPKKWIIENKVRKGDLIYIRPAKGADLNITTTLLPEKKEPQELVIDIIDKQPEKVRRELISAYLRDYSKITIKGKNLDELENIIRNEVNNLIGFEVVDRKSEKIIIENFLDPSKTNIKETLRKTDNIVREMIQETIGLAINKQSADTIARWDMDVNRLTFLVMKILSLSLRDREIEENIALSRSEILVFWDVIKNIERIGDYVKRSARYIVILREKKSPELKKVSGLYKEITEHYNNVLSAFYKKSIEKADEFSCTGLELFKKAEKIFLECKDTDGLKIISYIRRIIICLKDIDLLIIHLD